MGLLDSLSGPVGDLVGGWLGNEAAEDRQNAAQDFTRQMYQNRYQYTVKDMEAAGLNPMLAYSQGAGNPGGGSAVSAQSYGSPGTSFNQSRIASAQVANIEADTANKQASAELIQAQIAQTSASAGNLNAQTGLVNETVNKTRAEIAKIGEETANLPEERRRLIEETRRTKAAYFNLAESSALMAQQGQTEVSRRQNLEAAAAKMLTENLISQAAYDAMKKTGFIGVIAREVKVLSDIGADWLSPGKLIERFLPSRPHQERSTTVESHGTTYDRHGAESGGFSRSSTTTHR